MNRNNDKYLAHYGILGMKWGVRRYQNPDGTLTSAGRNRYSSTSSDSNTTKRVKKDLANLSGEDFRKKYSASKSRYMKRVDKYGDPYMNSPLAKAGKALERQAKKNENRIMEKARRAEKLAADRKKGISAANALISAQRKAKETGIVDSDFLNNPNISQKAKNKVTRLAEQSTKKEEKEVDKQITKRNTDLFIKSHNYAANRMNDELLEEFNKKWSPAFEGYSDWRDSPDYKKYENDYDKTFRALMIKSLSNNPNANFTTKLGSTYTARYLEKNGNIAWATQKEWEDYDKKRSGGSKT